MPKCDKIQIHHVTSERQNTPSSVTQYSKEITFEQLCELKNVTPVPKGKETTMNKSKSVQNVPAEQADEAVPVLNTPQPDFGSKDVHNRELSRQASLAFENTPQPEDEPVGDDVPTLTLPSQGC